MRIGVDVGGTKIEALALDAAGKELLRRRVPTPQGDYAGTLDAIAGLVRWIESETGETGTVGLGIPGTLDAQGRVKNANSICLNGNFLDKDMGRILEREVRLANDANCLAVSEATDGAAAGANVVFAVIVGTGCGGGVAINGRVHAGPNGVGGEWGHNPLPWMRPEEYPGPDCYCGKKGCIETWISGTGFAAEYARVNGVARTGAEIVEASTHGDVAAEAAMERLLDRMARCLAHMVHVLDPDVIPIGGGLSRIARIYDEMPERIKRYTFGGEFGTPIRPALHGDSSGVRGAAWLWPLER